MWLLEEHAPLKTTTITVQPNAPRYKVTFKNSKRNERKLERKWRETRSDEDKDKYVQALLSHI